jgi:hypothetical protein
MGDLTIAISLWTLSVLGVISSIIALNPLAFMLFILAYSASFALMFSELKRR